MDTAVCRVRLPVRCLSYRVIVATKGSKSERGLLLPELSEKLRQYFFVCVRDSIPGIAGFGARLRAGAEALHECGNCQGEFNLPAEVVRIPKVEAGAAQHFVIFRRVF